jgi:hypothetical protein
VCGQVREVSLLQFQARVNGRTAHVKFFPSRVVWTVAGASSRTEMVPVIAISAIMTSKMANSKWSLIVLTNGKTIEFVVDKAIADQAASILQELVGERPAPVDNAAPPSRQRRPR